MTPPAGAPVSVSGMDRPTLWGRNPPRPAVGLGRPAGGRAAVDRDPGRVQPRPAPGRGVPRRRGRADPGRDRPARVPASRPDPRPRDRGGGERRVRARRVPRRPRRCSSRSPPTRWPRTRRVSAWHGSGAPVAMAAGVVVGAVAPPPANWVEVLVALLLGVGIPLAIGRVMFNRRRRLDRGARARGARRRHAGTRADRPRAARRRRARDERDGGAGRRRADRGRA